MSLFRHKPIIVEAITFDELVAIGVASGAQLHNGMPWSFTYGGHPITHENDSCYLIPAPNGTARFNRGEMLISGVGGELYAVRADLFEASYEAAL